MSNDSSHALSGTGGALAGRYLTFLLGRESYGIAVLSVREIICLPEITSVPQLPAHVKGVINLRCRVIPIIELRCRFNLAPIEATEWTCIVVVQIRSDSGVRSLVGLIVDAVEELVNVPAGKIESVPGFGGTIPADYMVGMAKVGKRVKTLLDVDRVVRGDTAAPATENACTARQNFSGL
jgi:purine-binding chemotaxis protein CheW